MTESLQIMLGVIAIVALFSFSMGIRFHIDWLHWKETQRRKQLGRIVLNSIKL